jgi:hypothetical protein
VDREPFAEPGVRCGSVIPLAPSQGPGRATSPALWLASSDESERLDRPPDGQRSALQPKSQGPRGSAQGAAQTGGVLV